MLAQNRPGEVAGNLPCGSRTAQAWRVTSELRPVASQVETAGRRGYGQREHTRCDAHERDGQDA
jgi:hypothetical protein